MNGDHRLVWTNVAVADLEGIYDYVACRDSHAAASRLHAKVFRRIEALADFPKRCRVVPELREIGVTSYREALITPYRILFRIVSRDVVVLGIFDGRRDLAELLVHRALDDLTP